MPLATFGDYEVEGCKEDDDGVIDAGCSAREAEFFGVYKRLPPDPKDGHRFAEHVEDFDALSDAVNYAEFLAETENL